MAILSTLASPLAGSLRLLLDYGNPRALTVGRLAKLIGLFLLLANLKAVPMFWHARFWHAVFLHLLHRRSKLPTVKHLFSPVVVKSRSPLYECDFNFHKSNSTYFSDLDIARTHLVTQIIKKSLRARRVRREETYVALAGVSCVFRREIKPYEQYEVWTRVLAWDEKWFWVVSHFVTPGLDKKTGQRKVYAVALSKYVFKSGRKTIPPSVVLEESGVLPMRNDSVLSLSDVADTESNEGSYIMDTASTMREGLKPHLQHLPSEEPTRESSPIPPASVDASDDFSFDVKIDNWDWDTVEKLRLHGLKIARGMIMMDALEGEFEKGNTRVDGQVDRYGSLI